MADQSLRLELRQTIDSERHKLTEQEVGFLDLVLDLGSDVEVALSREALMNKDLFFNAPKEEEPRRKAQRRGSTRRLDCLMRRKSDPCTPALWHSLTIPPSPSHKKNQRSASFVAILSRDLGAFDTIKECETFDNPASLPIDKEEEQDFDVEKRRTSIQEHPSSVRGEQGPGLLKDTRRESRMMSFVFDSIPASWSIEEEESESESHRGQEEKIEDKDDVQATTSGVDTSYPTIMRTRMASMNSYNGQGFELGLFDLLPDDGRDKPSGCQNHFSLSSIGENDAYDAWADEDGKMTTIPFHILGTSGNDESVKPHVLSPRNMESLQPHLPFSKRGQSFWLKYSLVRDGSSVYTLLQKVRGAKYTLLAMETLDGEVFGAFTSDFWHVNHGFYGTGESFVWRMKEARAYSSKNLAQQADNEADIKVYRSSMENTMFQMCNQNRLAVGGGTSNVPREVDDDENGENLTRTIAPNEWGFALCFQDKNLIETTTSPCITFNSPSLSKEHADGSCYELVNVEAWTLTPCISVTDAEIMECGKIFLKRHLSI